MLSFIIQNVVESNSMYRYQKADLKKIFITLYMLHNIRVCNCIFLEKCNKSYVLCKI